MAVASSAMQFPYRFVSGKATRLPQLGLSKMMVEELGKGYVPISIAPDKDQFVVMLERNPLKAEKMLARRRRLLPR